METSLANSSLEFCFAQKWENCKKNLWINIQSVVAYFFVVLTRIDCRESYSKVFLACEAFRQHNKRPASEVNYLKNIFLVFLFSLSDNGWSAH